MKLTEFINILTETLVINGDMDIVGIADGKIYNYVEVNCPDDESPMYVELCN